MSMTREEAIAVLEESKRQNEVMRDNPSTFWVSHQMADGVKNAERRIAALDMALSALRPISREQVEKEWKGEWVDKGWDGDFSWQIDGRGNCWKVIECSQCQCKVSAQTNFCPNCGAPMMDEAVQMVMERLEALHSETKTD